MVLVNCYAFRHSGHYLRSCFNLSEFQYSSAQFSHLKTSSEQAALAPWFLDLRAAFVAAAAAAAAAVLKMATQQSQQCVPSTLFSGAHEWVYCRAVLCILYVSAGLPLCIVNVVTMFSLANSILEFPRTDYLKRWVWIRGDPSIIKTSGN